MKFDWDRLWNPMFWVQNHPTDWEWDAMLNRLLDSGQEVKRGYMVVQIGEVEVWVSNWPYAYGYPYTPFANVLPSVATRRRLRRLIPPVDKLTKVRAAVEASS